MLCMSNRMLLGWKNRAVSDACIHIVGLKRCGKSCRLRWMNYLRPNIKRGNFSEDEEDLIIRLHKLLGNRCCVHALLFLPHVLLFMDMNE